VVVTCLSCRAPLGDNDRFCESCGAATNIAPVATSIPPVATSGEPSKATTVDPVSTDSTDPSVEPAAPSNPASGALRATEPCRSCGARVGGDGYCTQCGTRALSQRDHWSHRVDDALAGVCDKGISHARNEDAMAIGRSVSGAAVLVVCDGVTSAPDSDRASLAAAKAACDSLCAIAVDTPSLATRISVWSAALVDSAVVAQREVIAVTRALGNPSEPPSSTFVAAVMDGDVMCAAWLGDSRAYWLGDDLAIALSSDDSMAAVHIADGMSVHDAESQSDAHTITRWLGIDAPSVTARTASHQAMGPGWLCLASDGLWNYASAPEAVAALVRGDGHDTDVVARGERVVAWANAQGGHDNITVALYRYEPHPVMVTPTTTEVTAAATAHRDPALSPLAAPNQSTAPTTQES
jgi:serine/threonine protein phosphatase PrpC